MEKLITQIITSACLISSFIPFNTNGQTSNVSSSFPIKTVQSKLFVETNLGIMGNTHVGFSGDDGGLWNNILNPGGEVGFEGTYVHKSGFLIKSEIFGNWKDYGEWSLDEDAEDRAQQSIGKSIGIGVIINNDALLNEHLGIFSISFGKIHSVIWMDGYYDSFGDLEFSDIEKFFNDNYFLDFNFKIIGHLKNKNLNERKLFFSKGLQVGILTGVNKSNWIRDSTREIVPGLNRTVPLSFYLKFSFGIGVNRLRN